MRKLILLALGAAAIAWYVRKQGEQPGASPVPDTPGYAPEPESAPDAPVAEEVTPAPRETILEESTTAVTAESDALTPDAVEAGEVVMPDTSADDPLVRQQEEAARAQAGRIGGTADSATADVEPEMRPVVEGSGDAEETFEAIEDEGR